MSEENVSESIVHSPSASNWSIFGSPSAIWEKERYHGTEQICKEWHRAKGNNFYRDYLLPCPCCGRQPVIVSECNGGPDQEIYWVRCSELDDHFKGLKSKPGKSPCEIEGPVVQTYGPVTKIHDGVSEAVNRWNEWVRRGMPNTYTLGHPWWGGIADGTERSRSCTTNLAAMSQSQAAAIRKSRSKEKP